LVLVFWNGPLVGVKFGRRMTLCSREPRDPRPLIGGVRRRGTSSVCTCTQSTSDARGYAEYDLEQEVIGEGLGCCPVEER
jgi:hypothetical protein